MKCKYEESCGYEICTMEECCDYEKGTMTNADRIRSMSDKELAFWLAERYVKEAVLQLKDKGVTPSATDIREVEERMYMVWARWLQQPAEDL